MSAGEILSWAYADGTACWVPIDPDHEQADEETLASGNWAVCYDEQSGYWTGETL